MIINNNIPALNTYRQLGINQNSMQKSMEKLSSGLRINRAGDDAAGLAISEKMRAQIRGLDQASRNAADGISMIQTAEGALGETQNILQRMRELAVQASNDTNVDVDREEIQKEMNELTSEINRIGNTTEFNTKKLLNGELSDEFVVSEAETTEAGTVDVTKAVDQTISVGDEPISWGGSSEADFDVVINGAADNGFDWSALDTGGPNNLVITKVNDDEYTVSYSGTDTASETLTIAADEVAYDPSNETFSYNNQGISFSFSKEDATNWEDGDAVTIDLNTIAGAGTDVQGTHNTVAQKVPLTIGGTDGDSTFTMTDITVDGDSAAIIAGVDNFDLSWNEAANESTITLKNGSDTVSTYTFSQDVGDKLSFNADGISFEFTVDSGDSTGTDGTISGSFALKTGTVSVVTKPVETVAAVIEDRSANFQIGANQNQALNLSINDMRSEALGISGTGNFVTFEDENGDTVEVALTNAKNVTDGTDSTGVEKALDVSSFENATKAVTVLNNAIEKVSAERSMLGASQNRLEHTISNLNNSSENLSAAESRIRDVDMAKEMMEMTRANILSQASQSMLAQANSAPQSVLQLLG